MITLEQRRELRQLRYKLRNDIVEAQTRIAKMEIIRDALLEQELDVLRLEQKMEEGYYGIDS